MTSNRGIRATEGQIVPRVRSIGGIGLLYQPHDPELPKSSPKDPKDWVAEATLITNVYYNLLVNGNRDLPSGTLVPLGKEIEVELNKPRYYLQLEDGRIFPIELRRDPRNEPAPYIFLTYRA